MITDWYFSSFSGGKVKVFVGRDDRGFEVELLGDQGRRLVSEDSGLEFTAIEDIAVKDRSCSLQFRGLGILWAAGNRGL